MEQCNIVTVHGSDRLRVMFAQGSLLSSTRQRGGCTVAQCG
jgi:hypothetical protein